jgi:hypothetical protein
MRHTKVFRIISAQIVSQLYLFSPPSARRVFSIRARSVRRSNSVALLAVKRAVPLITCRTIAGYSYSANRSAIPVEYSF